MIDLSDILRDFCLAEGEVLRIDGSPTMPYASINPRQLLVEVARGASARLVVLHATPEVSSLRIVLAEEAQLEVVELFTAEAFVEVDLSQAAHSSCRVTTIELSSAQAVYTINLDGALAENRFGGLFLLSGKEHGVVKLRTNHNVSDCRSDSAIKGVAGGSAVGEFYGLVYVAPDAQRTDARQQSRNVLLGDTARIITRPQLEIYADDVKCSHGATVGQMASDAILYMRQRGLSEVQARRLQIEGFAGDIVHQCGIDELAEALMAHVAAKMDKL
ncbi:MAG: SufD family Fe-S cluster assembly protein [Alistipes sp.]